MSVDFAALPSVTSLLGDARVRELIEAFSRSLVLHWIREELQARRGLIAEAGASGSTDEEREKLVQAVVSQAHAERDRQLARVVNATGIILHTGLGRASLCDEAIQAVVNCARSTNVEVDLRSGERSYRGSQLNQKWKTLTDCEDSVIVNNNAAATLLTLQALCAGREVIISRGQLIEIGGSFRLPDIFALGGAVLREVGTTNRTRLDDYAAAIGLETSAILLVHPSNYQIVGFSETPGVGELTELAHKHELMMIDDIGSGCLMDLTQFGLPPEPTFQASIAAGADVVLGSGDKLFGGAQAGIILGRSKYIGQIKEHPLARTMRIDKLTLAAISATMDQYLCGRSEQLPVFRMLRADVRDLEARAGNIIDQVRIDGEWSLAIVQQESEVGGGSLPGLRLPTSVISVSHKSLSEESIALRLRTGSIRVMPRISQHRVLIDLRSVPAEDDLLVAEALRQIMAASMSAKP